MGIEANFNMDALRKYAYSRIDDFTLVMLNAYKGACMDMVERAKSTNTYQDQTRSLRSSIGCVINYKGKEWFNYFASEGGENGALGAAKGLDFAREKAKQYSDKTVVAIVVAGEDYALYVEAKGFDVLTGSTRQFEADLSAEISNAKQAFGQHIKEHFDL
jgi:hypothetical protein